MPKKFQKVTSSVIRRPYAYSELGASDFLINAIWLYAFKVNVKPCPPSFCTALLQRIGCLCVQVADWWHQSSRYKHESSQVSPGSDAYERYNGCSVIAKIHRSDAFSDACIISLRQFVLYGNGTGRYCGRLVLRPVKRMFNSTFFRQPNSGLNKQKLSAQFHVCFFNSGNSFFETAQISFLIDCAHITMNQSKYSATTPSRPSKLRPNVRHYEIDICAL